VGKGCSATLLASYPLTLFEIIKMRKI